MSGYYGSGKRARAQQKAEKKREKEMRRWRKREEGPSEPEIVSASEIVGNLPSIEEAMQHIPVAESQASGNHSAPAIPARLFVGGLSWDTTAKTLRQCFEKYGVVADATVVQDRDTGRSRGFGFVEMANRKDAAGAIAGMNGVELDGRYIRVNIATDRRAA